MSNNQNHWTFDNGFEEYANQNFFNPKPKIKFLNKMVEDTDSEASLKNYVYSFSKMSSLEKEYKKDISRMNVNQIKFVLNSCINSYDGFRNMKGLLKLYLTFMDYPYMDEFISIRYNMMDVEQKFFEKFFASYEDLYEYLMSDSYIKETYIYEMLVVLLIYLGMPEEYIPIIEVANVDVKNKVIYVDGIAFNEYPESFFELCELSFQDKRVLQNNFVYDICSSKYLIKRKNVGRPKPGDDRVDDSFVMKSCKKLSYPNLSSHCNYIIQKDFSVLSLKRSALFYKFWQYEQNVQSMKFLKNSQLKALFEEEFNFKIGTPKIIYNAYLQWKKIFIGKK